MVVVLAEELMMPHHASLCGNLSRFLFLSFFYSEVIKTDPKVSAQK
jgi:hypothetical protein